MGRPPILSIGRRKLRRFVRMDRRERWAVLRAATWLLVIDLGLRTVGFRMVRRRLVRPKGALSGAGGAEPDRHGEAESLARAVDVAARHHLYPMRCLARALTVQTLLARRGIVGELRIGVRKEAKADMKAHAWIEVDGEPLGADGEAGCLYAVLGPAEERSGPQTSNL